MYYISQAIIFKPSDDFCYKYAVHMNPKNAIQSINYFIGMVICEKECFLTYNLHGALSPTGVKFCSKQIKGIILRKKIRINIFIAI